MERLALLLEECGEVQQIIGKILRHGYDSHHPENNLVNNRMLLEKELGDLQFAINLMVKKKDVDDVEMVEHTQEAWTKKKPYLHHQNI